MENLDQVVVPEPQNNRSLVGSRVYEELQNTSCDCRVVRILRRLLSGRFGELTLLNTFLYQLILTNNNPNLLNSLQNIYNDHVIHSQLIGRAISSFCGCPRFSTDGTFWNARRVNYTTDVNAFIRENISALNSAIGEYQNANSKITNESLRRLFDQIIEDKRRHIEIFNRFLT